MVKSGWIRVAFLAIAVATGILLLTRGVNAADRAPNIIFVMADDLGYGDLGCYGQVRIQTPCLDTMAHEGMRFTDFYAGSTVCAPSRCVLMTGYHTGHAFIRGNGKENLRPEDVTVAELLKEAGYATGLIGKWGLGQVGGTGVPTRQGFDYFFGYMDQGHAHNYYPSFLVRGEERVPLKNVVPQEGRYGQGVASEKVQYSHDLLVTESLEFIERHSGEPFFLYMPLTIPHANNEARQEGMEVPDLGVYAEKDWPAPQKAHAAMITRMDADVGKMFGLLKKLNIDQQTIVFFTSDNGPHKEGGNDPFFNDSNGPLAGLKRSLTEGGIRVPMIASWPAKISPNSQSSFVGGFWDVMPTLAQLAGVSDKVPQGIDGISFVPTLLGQRDQLQHDHVFWAFYEQGGARALRKGPWKVVQQPYHSPVRLYNLDADLGEERDVAADKPELVAQLTRLMDEAYGASDRWKFPESPPKRGRQKKEGKNRGAAYGVRK